MNFEQLFESLNNNFLPKVGDVVKGTVTAISKGLVFVDAGLKSDGAIPAEEFYNASNELTVKVGDEVDVAVESLENGNGEVGLSRKKAKSIQAWTRLAQIHDSKENVLGYVSSKVKGGFTVEIDGIRAFLPGSLVELRPSRETPNLEGKELEFKVIKLDQKRNNIVVSRRAVLENEGQADREVVYSQLEEGKIFKGTIKNLTDYGAFVDLGHGVDGLLHITDMSWKRVKHPSEVVTVGDQVDVVVLKFDKERSRVSLGLKQLQQDPWVQVVEKYKAGDRLTGKVTNLTEYGCFVEVLGGIEGLVHVSEMDWTVKATHPSKLVSLGEEVEVQILEIDELRRRISLGLKQCKENPWANFDANHKRGEKITGHIKSVTDFGLFIGLDGGIDGLVHNSDLGNNYDDVRAVFNKGDVLSAYLTQIDAENQRISLSVKQLLEEELPKYYESLDKSKAVKVLVGAKTDKVRNALVDGRFIGQIAADLVADVPEFKEVELFVKGFNKKANVLELSKEASAE